MKNNTNSNSEFRIKYGAVSTVFVCLFIAAVVLINIVVATLGTKVNLKIDLTQSRILDFSDITYKTVKGLKKDVNVYSLIPESAGNELAVSLEEILNKYNRLSSHIKYKVIDANKNPGFMTKYTKDASQLSSFSVVFECGNKFKIVDLAENVSYMSNDGQYIDLPNAEKKFTSAILYVVSGRNTKIAVLDGMHGEYIFQSDYPAYDMYTETFKNENYDIEKIDIASQDIPDDADIVFLANPMTDYTEEEIAKLEKFLEAGKSIQICFEQYKGNLPNLDKFFREKWGINLDEGILLEGDSQKYTNGAPYSIIPTYESSAVTDPLMQARQNTLIILPAPVTIDDKDGISSTLLAMTSDKAYVKTNTEATTFEYEAGDIKGKYVLSAVLTDEKTNGRIDIIAGGSFILGAQYPTYANKDFYQNSVAFLADKEQEISIRPKDMSSKTFLLSNQKMLIFLIVFVLVIPLAVLVSGLVIWLKRRRL